MCIYTPATKENIFLNTIYTSIVKYQVSRNMIIKVWVRSPKRKLSKMLNNITENPINGEISYIPGFKVTIL